MLKSAGLKFSQIVRMFTSPSPTAFQYLCSLITKGIASSPKRLRKRESIQELFVTLYKNYLATSASPKRGKFPKDDLNAQDIYLSYMQISIGLRTFSPRIAACSLDELLTLPFLIDIDGDGLITWEDFYAFCTLCDEAQRNHVNNAKHCFEYLFADLLNEKSKDTSKSAILKKISDSAEILRENSVSTMNILLESVESNEHNASLSEASIDLIFQRMQEELTSIQSAPISVSHRVVSSPKRLQQSPQRELTVNNRDTSEAISKELNDALKVKITGSSTFHIISLIF